MIACRLSTSLPLSPLSIAELVESLQAITKLKGEVELVPLELVADDGKVIADERTYN